MSGTILQVGDNATMARVQDIGGAVAQVLSVGASSAPATGDKLLQVGDNETKIRLRDMGDGSHAEVIFGV